MINEDIFKDEDAQNEQDVVVEQTSDNQQNLVNFVNNVEIAELSDSENKQVILAEEDEGAVFEIENAEIQKPKLEGVNGPIPPEPFNPNKPEQKGYTSKMHITYKGNNYISILGKIRWYVSVKEGKTVITPWFNTRGLDENCLEDQFCSPVSRLYYLACVFKNVEPGKMTQKEFIDFLNAGRKVKVKQFKTKFEGEWRYRVDIVEIVE